MQSAPTPIGELVPPRRRGSVEPTPVDALTHDDKRVNIPTADQVDSYGEPGDVETVAWGRDPTLDPQLVWRGKSNENLVTDAPPIYQQEKIDACPRRRLGARSRLHVAPAGMAAEIRGGTRSEGRQLGRPMASKHRPQREVNERLEYTQERGLHVFRALRPIPIIAVVAGLVLIVIATV